MDREIFGNTSRRKLDSSPATYKPSPIGYKPYLRSKVDKNLILNWWREQTPHKRRFKMTRLNVEEWTLSNTPQGMGDTVIISHLPRVAQANGKIASIYMPNQFFNDLRLHIPHPFASTRHKCVLAADAQRDCDLGNGHFIQRLQRLFGFKPELKPHGCVVPPVRSPRKGDKVVLHFDAGTHAQWQQRHIHPRAREVYPENLAIIEQFVAMHPELSFFEIGRTKSPIRGVTDCTNRSLAETISIMDACDYFVGIISGPLHLAAALNLKLITIINFPDPTLIYLPTLRNIDLVESEWFYPQSVHLHQDGEGELVPRFSLESLEQSFAGEIYPYFSDEYLPLINEKL